MHHIVLIPLACIAFSLISSFARCDKSKTPCNALGVDKDRRDSMLISFVVREWKKEDWYTFSDESKMYKLKNSEVDVAAIRIFYSPDKLRMISWVEIRMPNAPTRRVYNDSDPNVNRVCYDDKDTVFHSRTIVGFRSQQDAIWELYPLDLFNVSCAGDRDALLKIMCEYFFERMSKAGEFVAGNSLDSHFGGLVRYDLDEERKKYGLSVSNEVVFKEYGYNLNDPDFWRSSLIWDLGARIPGLYNFQTIGNVNPTSVGQVERVPPEVRYPSYIRSMYIE